jgi:hypothetical protein
MSQVQEPEPDPPLRPWGRLLSRYGDPVRVVLATLQALAIIVGALWFVYSYRDSLRSEQVSSTLSMLEDDEHEQTVQAIERVIATGQQSNQFIVQAKGALASASLCGYAATIEQDKDLAQALTTYRRQITAIAVCIDRGACDRQAFCDFAVRFILDTRSTFCPFFERQNIVWKEDLTAPMDRLILTCLGAKRTSSPYAAAQPEQWLAVPTFCQTLSKQSGKDMRSLFDCSSPPR